MKSDHSDAPPSRRPAPEVCGNVLGNGQAVVAGSDSVGGESLAAAGTSVGIPAGTWAANPLPGAPAMATATATATAMVIHGTLRSSRTLTGGHDTPATCRLRGASGASWGASA